jgi:3-methyladenine DNA glycosylase AlkD
MTKADLTTWTKDVRKLFYLRQNPEKKPQMEAYIKNKFVFFGVSSPERKIILKEAMSNLEGKAQLLDAAEACYEQDEREFHYLGMELLFRSRSIWKADVYDTLKSFVTRHSWWDTVDSLASNSFGAYFKMFPEMVENQVPELIASPHMWLRRTSLLYQLKYKNDVDTTMLEQAIKNMHHEQEFFIKKAIGWALRQYAKYNPDWVMELVDKYPLQNLSRKEALKHLDKK